MPPAQKKVLPDEDALKRMSRVGMREVVAEHKLFETSLVTWLSARECREAILGRWPLRAKGLNIAERDVANLDELAALVADRKAAWKVKHPRK